MMMKRIVLQLFLISSCLSAFSQETIVKYLSGRDKDHTVQWDFYCTEGRQSGKWSKIPVPSNWELQGFGTYNYGHDKEKANEQGLYKYQFFASKWSSKRIFIVFEGSMTDTEVKINGKLAGSIHQGAFYRFKYDITDLLKFNSQNLLEVTVDKTSANKSVNEAERESDFWVFGGIFRPVYLEIVPETYIDRTAINALADGSFLMDVYAENLKSDNVIEAQVQTLAGKNVGAVIIAKSGEKTGQLAVQGKFDNPLLWSAEFPNLYQVLITAKGKAGTIHQVKQKFGFRTVELRKNDGLYVNDAKIILKGTNRHSFWPETGRTLSHKLDLMDVKLMKEMNNNAVRMSHYPPNQGFLDICDSLGLYVLDELTGWQSKYDTIVGRKLVKELVVRDVNHPSILFWDNGNEGGWNTGLDNDYQLYDPQNRTVLHPWAKFNGTDTHHYPDYKAMVKTVETGQEVYFPTEFLHGLYDGGAGAGLDDFWTQMVKHPHGAGGFIWAYVDESVVRTDKNNIYDGDGNHAPDGVLGPHREKEASFYTIKEIWSPIYINPQPVDQDFDGRIAIENRYSFTNLSQCRFKWQLIKLASPESGTTKPKILVEGKPASLALMPGEKGVLNLNLPKTWRESDVLYLTAYNPSGETLFTWSWVIKQGLGLEKQPSLVLSKNKISAEERNDELVISGGDLKYYFDKKTGYITRVMKGKTEISLSGGPVLAGPKTNLSLFKFFKEGQQYIVQANYDGEARLNVKWTLSAGQAARLDYSYTQSGEADFVGITFNYPEDKITGMKWRGRGPYRVWKNRLKGQQYGLWHKDYNNTITGENWNYPEFKGYHAEINWVVFENKQSPFTVFTENENMFLQVFHPEREKGALKNNNVEPPFPAGDIGFLQGISAIGTKFHSAATMGPQGQKNINSGQPVNATLWFKF
ncbi:MAG: glycoside hydrolase family 2 TIM barrel-domain containing protein [Sphingobacteriaceae bacterium]